MSRSTIHIRQSEVVILSDRPSLARESATRFISLAQLAIRARGRFVVALSGGSTPRDLFQLLATQEFLHQIDWSRVHLFWGDERTVPPEHPDSNFKMANDALISRVPISAGNVHRIRAELPPDTAAREYQELLRQFFSLAGEAGEGARAGIPRFDLILLGLGPDAHIASLFPHTPLLRETARWVAAQYIDKLNTYRISFTPPLINAAENILFLVAGADKSNAVRSVLCGNISTDEFPAQLIQPTNGHVVWFIDQTAAAMLTNKGV